MSDTALPADAEAWQHFFSRFDDVVLVANSDDVDIERLMSRFGDGNTLFVFFNKTYKVLAGRFDRSSLLVARSSDAGANIVYRNEVDNVAAPLDGPAFRGILNLKCGSAERFSVADAFRGRAVGHLDLVSHFADFYPPARVPSSGFALAVWLAEGKTSRRIHLAGFSARRSVRWKLFPVHDWTFEQTLLRLLIRAKKLQAVDMAVADEAFDRITERFPAISKTEVALTLGEVLSERLSNTDGAVDRLFSLTRWQSRLDGVLRAMKPRTRKQRLERRRNEGKDS